MIILNRSKLVINSPSLLTINTGYPSTPSGPLFLGYQSIGGTTGGIFSGGSYVGSKFTGVTGTVSKIYAYLEAPFDITPQPMSVSIYSISGGSPVNVLASGTGTFGPTFDWYSANISYAMTNGVEYFFTVWPDTSYNIKYDAGASNQSFEKYNQTYNTWEDPLLTGADFNWYNTVVSIKVEYTV